VINSVYEALEKVALTRGMPRPDKERMLLEEVAKFKKLKEQVVLRKIERKEPAAAGTAPAPPAPAPEPREIPQVEAPAREEARKEPSEVPRPAQMPPHEAFAYALEEIKDMIRAEFRALRAEIKLWRESK
jgi:hypothetical protein